MRTILERSLNSDLGGRILDLSSVRETGMLPDGVQLFRDSMPLQVLDTRKIVTESIGGKKSGAMQCTGIFQRADAKNANGRVYPESVLKAAVKRLQEAVEKRRVMGEFDHPPDAKIHLDRVSHLVTKLWMENKVVYGQMEVINDDRCPMGNMLACYLDRGIQVGISSRGVGDMELAMHEGEEAYLVQEGFEFVTFDAVAEPSVKDTQLKKLHESMQKRKVNPRQLREMREKLLAKELKKFLFS